MKHMDFLIHVLTTPGFSFSTRVKLVLLYFNVLWLEDVAYLILLALVLLSILNLVTTVFEDGSFGVGRFPYIVSGCFPWGICR